MLLSVDPGFSNFGYAIFDQTGSPVKVGVLTTEKSKRKMVRVSDDNATRMADLSVSLATLILNNKIKGILGELPHSGSQNARAMKDMTAATAIAVSVFALLRVPVEWTTPTEVKKALSGKKTASKTDMMVAASERMGWEVKTKKVNLKSGKTRIDNVYFPLGKKTGANKFEHIADAIGAFCALQNGNIARMVLTAQKGMVA